MNTQNARFPLLQTILDLALIAVTAGLGAWTCLLVEIRFPDKEWTPFGAVACAIGLALMTAACLKRSSRTWLSLLLMTSAMLVFAFPAFLHGLAAWFAAPSALVLYSGGRAKPSPPTVALTVLTMLATAGNVACGYRSGGMPSIQAFTAVLFLTMIPVGMGRLRGMRESEHEATKARLAQVEREAAQERRLAAQDERTRIAREMHDVVAHSLAVIAAQSEGGRVASEHSPEQAAQAFTTIGDTARDSLKEMRSLLGVLRTDDDASRLAAPTLDDLPGLIDVSRSSGADIRWSVTGEPRAELLSEGAQLVVYRAVQEMVANGLRHGSGEVEIHLTWHPAALEVSGINPVEPEGGSEEGTSSEDRTAQEHAAREIGGMGLTGMQERAALYHGILVVRNEDGRHITHLTMPLEKPQEKDRR